MVRGGGTVQWEKAVDWVKNVDPRQNIQVTNSLCDLLKTSRNGHEREEIVKIVSEMGNGYSIRDALDALRSRQLIETLSVDESELNAAIKQLFVGSIRQEGKENKYEGDLYLLYSYLSLDKNQRDPTEEQIAITELSKVYPKLVKYIQEPDSEPYKILTEYWESSRDKKRINKWMDELSLLGSIEKLLTRENGLDKLTYFHEQCGIINVHRFSTELLENQYQKRESNLPYGVIILPLADYNGAFASNVEVYDKLRAKAASLGLEVRVGEAADVKKLYTRLKRWDKLYRKSYKIEFVVVGGHGSPDSITFGPYWKSHRSLSSDKVEHNKFAERAKTFLAPEAPIVFNACSTGLSEDGFESIAQKYSGILKTSIRGPSQPASIKDMKISRNPNGKLELEVEYNDAEANKFTKGLLEKDE